MENSNIISGELAKSIITHSDWTIVDKDFLGEGGLGPSIIPPGTNPNSPEGKKTLKDLKDKQDAKRQNTSDRNHAAMKTKGARAELGSSKKGSLAQRVAKKALDNQRDSNKSPSLKKKPALKTFEETSSTISSIAAKLKESFKQHMMDKQIDRDNLKAVKRSNAEAEAKGGKKNNFAARIAAENTAKLKREKENKTVKEEEGKESKKPFLTTLQKARMKFKGETADQAKESLRKNSEKQREKGEGLGSNDGEIG